MTKTFSSFLVIATCTLILTSLPSQSHSSTQSELLEITSLQQTEDGDSSAREGNTDKENNPEDEKEEHPEINISDSIPVEEIVHSWQTEYAKFVDKWGLDESVVSRVIATSIIFILLIVGLYLVKKISKALRKKVQSLAGKLTINLQKIAFYEKSIYWLFVILLLALLLSAILTIWGISFNDYVSDEFLINSLANGLTVYLIVIGGSVLVDIIANLVEKSFMRWGKASQSRTDTLLPIAKNTVSGIFITIFTLMVLAEIGINVMPLLAGAGVLGFAIGFGAQTIIKDLLTGFIIILEDLIQVGDVVTLADRTGIIEKITIRKVQMRNLDGTVYTVPFGEIAIVENLTKEFSYAMFDIGIAYREDVDSLCELLKNIDQDLRDDENYSSDILDNMEIFGLDEFADSAVIIKARIKTRPSEQWRIGREFNKRMKRLSDENNIEIPFPHQTIYFGEDKSGNAPSLKLAREAETKETQE